MQWLEPWVAIAELDWEVAKKRAYCTGWETQLEREIGAGHVVFATSALLIARRFDRDDALFELAGGHVAEVHLTWSRGEGAERRWPAACVFPSIQDWARDSMAVQHKQWVKAA